MEEEAEVEEEEEEEGRVGVMDRAAMGGDKLQDVPPTPQRSNTSFSGLTLSRNSSRRRSVGELY